MGMLKTKWAAIGALALLACGDLDMEGANPEVANEEDLGESTQDLQRDYAFSDYFAVVTNSTSAQSKSTGAIRVANLDANTSHGSCGLTFVSKHYAVTAAHCVSNLALNGSVTVEQYTTTNLNTFGIMFGSSLVSGNWPSWTKGANLTSADGYSVTSLTCTLRRRCHTNIGGAQNCPSQLTSNYGNVDIALLHCANRNSSFFATTTNTDTANRDVETWWYHEILALPGTPNVTDQYWLHYGKAPAANRNDNYHYRVRHQLFPLRSTSRPRPFNTPLNYKDIGHSGAYTQTDTPLCHGTSGSGVFLTGQNVLVGPFVSAAPTWTAPNGTVYPLLCHQPEKTVAGQGISSHVKAVVTHTFVTNSPEVMADR